MMKKVKNHRFGNSLVRPKAKNNSVVNLDLRAEAISNVVINEHILLMNRDQFYQIGNRKLVN